MKNLIEKIEIRIKELEGYAIKAGQDSKTKFRVNRNKLRASPLLNQGEEKFVMEKKELITRNESFYFRPAAIGVEKAYQSIRRWRNGDLTAAISLMEEAKDNFPESEDLLFNLSKMYIEEGTNKLKGLTLLLNYYIFRDNSNYYKKKIRELFYIEEDDTYYAGSIMIENQKITFYVDEEQNMQIENDHAIEMLNNIPLAFKVPRNLNLERKDKENIEFLDYKFVKEIIKDDYLTFELNLPKEKFLVFISEFYATVLELAGKEKIETLIDFKELELTLKMKNISRKYYHQGMDEPVELAIPLDEQLISVLKFTVPFHKENEALIVFRLFCKKYIITNETQKELEEAFVEKERIETEAQGDWQSKMEKKEELKRLLKMSKEYAELKIIQSNIKMGKENSFEFNTEEYEVFEEYRMDFISNFNEKYKELLDINNDFKVMNQNNRAYQINELMLMIADKNFRDNINIRLNEIIVEMKNFPHLTLNPMRSVLEGTIKKIYSKKGKKIIEKNEFGKIITIPLAILWNQISKEVKNEKVQASVGDLILKGNIGSHYDDVSPFREIKYKEANDLLGDLLNCINYLVLQYEL